MNRSQDIFKLQQLDSELDAAERRIAEIDLILADNEEMARASKKFQTLQESAEQKSSLLKQAEAQVAEQNLKIDQNQKKLYGGAVSNPKDLEDLQLEAASLQKYMQVLEDRQLEAMIDAEQAQTEHEQARSELDRIKSRLEKEHSELLLEKSQLQEKISEVRHKKESYLGSQDFPDLPLYRSLRKSSGGIAVSLMISSSCSSCGADIPSAIEQEARSPEKLIQCPTCKRILHPGK